MNWYKANTILLPIIFFLFTSAASASPYKDDIRPRIQRMAGKLIKADRLHFGYPVGFSARPETNNKYYKVYQRLEAKATDEELVALAMNNSNNITFYAFRTLVYRNHSSLRDIFLAHVNDTTEVSVAAGCTGSIYRVNTFMLQYLEPVEGKTNQWMTKEEYDHYAKLINMPERRR